MAQFRKDIHQYLPDGKTIFEVMMLADQYGNLVGPANPSGMAVDAFGRARVSQPLTLFDSFHRYQDNGKISVRTTGGGTSTYEESSSSILMNVGTASGDEVIRETSRVFAYQPGKSLQVLLTFTMSPPKTNLRQRVGYFNPDNGIFLQQNNNTASFVRRSSSTGSLVENVVNQADWNLDKLDGTGPSKLTLDLTKSQIFFMDIEWLGVGSVRCGFVINGQPIHCHSFHHANVGQGTYMTTAILPGRVEITNTGVTSSASTYRQICFSVISEGGYELKGRPRSVSTPVLAPRDLPVAGTYYPVMSIRLKPNRLNAIVIPKNIHVLGVGNNSRIAYKIIGSPVLTGADWVSVSDDSFVEYDKTATSYTGGVEFSSGFSAISNQATQSISLDGSMFKYQLERNPFTATPFAFTIAVATSAGGDDILASIDWEEV